MSGRSLERKRVTLCAQSIGLVSHRVNGPQEEELTIKLCLWYADHLHFDAVRELQIELLMTDQSIIL